MEDIERDRWGRPLIVPAGGGKPIPYTRVSTLAKTLSDGSALTKWAQRQVLLGAAVSPDLCALASTLDPDADRQQLDKIAEQAGDRARSKAAANMGTATHSALQAIVEARPTAHLPQQVRDAAERAVAALQALGLSPVRSEVFVVSDGLQAAGTADLICEGSRGGLYVADLKTSSASAPKYAAVEWAIQLAAYADGVPYTPGSGRQDWDEPPDTDTGLVVHVPQQGGDAAVYRVDLTEGMRLAELAVAVRGARRSKPLAIIDTPTAEDAA